MELRNALIVDDEPDIRELIEMTLIPMGVHCVLAETLADARRALAGTTFAFCITDMRLPDGNGLELVKAIQQATPEMPVAVITAHGNVESAVEALKLGAFDFVSKPFDLSVLRKLVDSALKLGPGREASARDVAGHGSPGSRLLGDSPAMQAVRRLIEKLARSQAPVFISGESGTGKELAARSIHESGPRADKAFVPVNCGAIPEHLMESEFFGYRKGSFTGATQDKIGLFQAADGGTLFLDEVADLPAHMQVKLLRAIQERAVRAIGSQKETTVDVRIISASHRDLQEMIDQGVFRQDLYYRLNVIELRMPSLRDRRSDLPALTRHVLNRLGERLKLDRPATLAPEALAKLQAYPFPGNVRELENILERASTLAETETIEAVDLDIRTPHQRDTALPDTPQAASDRSPSGDGDPQRQPTTSPADGLETYLEDIERSVIMEALEATRYNKTAAAEKLGITFRALRYRLKKLGID